MRRSWLVVVVVVVQGLMAGCGESSSEAPAPDPADATSCDDLANKYVEVTASIVDRIGDRSDTDMESPPADLEAAANDWMGVMMALVPRIAELCASGDEFDVLLCDRESEIVPGGEAGEHFLRDNYPTCSN